MGFYTVRCAVPDKSTNCIFIYLQPKELMATLSLQESATTLKKKLAGRIQAFAQLTYKHNINFK